MGKQNRQRRPARRTPFKDPKPIVLIITEGELTEPQYFSGFKNEYKNSRVEIRVEAGSAVPKTIVATASELRKQAEKSAKQQRDDNLRYDQVWCVFDVDEHANLAEARQQADDNHIKLAISNPCFEIWLWLHFAEQPGIQHRHDIQRKMKEHIPDYDKTVNFEEYRAGYNDALHRARRLQEAAITDGEEGRNPSTGVWRLTEVIREEA